MHEFACSGSEELNRSWRAVREAAGQSRICVASALDVGLNSRDCQAIQMQVKGDPVRTPPPISG